MKKDSIASHYRGEEGKKYSQHQDQDILDHLGYQLQKKFYLPYLNKDMEVLDFGCGNGSLTKAVSPYVKTIEGLEINDYPRKIAIEQQKLKVYASLASLPIDKTYDAIISNHALEHIPNVIDTLKTIHKHLQPNGTFITVLPIDDFRTKKNRTWNPNDIDHHLQTWTPLLFGNALQEAGFTPVQLKIITHAWTPRLFFLGDNILQSIACYLFSAYKKRRQLLAVASNA